MQLAIHRLAAKQRLSFQRLFAGSANAAKPVRTPLAFASGDYTFVEESSTSTHRVWQVLDSQNRYAFLLRKPTNPNSGPHVEVEKVAGRGFSRFIKCILTLPQTEEEMLAMLAKGKPIFKMDDKPIVDEKILHWMAEIAQAQSSEGVPKDAEVDLSIAPEMLVRLKAFELIEKADAMNSQIPNGLALKQVLEYVKDTAIPNIADTQSCVSIALELTRARHTVSGLVTQIMHEVFTEESRQEEELGALKQKLLQTASQKLLGKDYQATT